MKLKPSMNRCVQNQSANEHNLIEYRNPEHLEINERADGTAQIRDVQLNQSDSSECFSFFWQFLNSCVTPASNAYANLHRRSHVQKERNSISSYRDPSMAYSDYGTNNYAGLINQSATCYLNATIQILFMTPEIRNAVIDAYENTTPNEPVYQLGLLFVRMQSEKRMLGVSTKGLTKCLEISGYTPGDAHDLFNMLLMKFEEFLPKLSDQYRFTKEERYKCLECNKEYSSFENSFILILPVKNTYTLEEAFSKYFEEKLLDGENMYNCMECGRLNKAIKNRHITKFPYFFTVLLSRSRSDQSIVTFQSQFCPAQHSVSAPREFALGGVGSDHHQHCEKTVEKFIKQIKSTINKTSSRSRTQGQEKINKKGSKDEKPVYDLFAVVVYSGCVYSVGHAFAYIKDLDKDEWFEFNDTYVQPIHPDKIRNAFGGSDCHARMLIYRKIDRANEKFKHILAPVNYRAAIS